MDICKHNEWCGGCLYQEMPYSEQIEMKAKEVLRLLAEKGMKPKQFLGVAGSPAQYRYRNKMEYTFGDEKKGGPMTLGMHKKGQFMSIVTVDECQLVHEDFNRLLRASLDFAVERGYDFYHKKSHQGLLRNLVLRRGVRTNEILINLITSSQGDFDESAYVDCLRSLPLEHKIAGILHTINDSPADAVNCDSMKVLAGNDYYTEEIMGLQFRVSAFSFFQTNVEAVEALYTEALNLLDNVEGKTVFDLYCGTGTITQALALRAKKVIGVELVPEAVASAEQNAAQNGLSNCRFIAGDVLKILPELEEKPDVIVVDPPRSGIHPKALQKILNYGVNEIIYISCNPKTMAENMEMVRLCGYSLTSLKVFDNFPHTKHTETVCLLSRK